MVENGGSRPHHDLQRTSPKANILPPPERLPFVKRGLIGRLTYVLDVGLRNKLRQKLLIRDRGQQFEQLDNADFVAKVYLDNLGLTWEDLQGKDILDIGAGSALFAQAAQRRGIRVTSVDRILGGLGNQGEVPAGIPYIVADFREGIPSLPDANFDMIVARAAVHSMVDISDDLRKVLQEARRLLRPGGEFRFGPGLKYFTNDMSEAEWHRLMHYYTQQQLRTLSSEELVDLAKLQSQASKEVEKGEQEESITKHMNKYERNKYFEHKSLEQMKSFVPDTNISVHRGFHYGEPMEYIVMKKEGKTS